MQEIRVFSLFAVSSHISESMLGQSGSKWCAEIGTLVTNDFVDIWKSYENMLDT